VNKRKRLNGPPSLCGPTPRRTSPRPSSPRPTRGNPLHHACAQSRRSPLRQITGAHSLAPPAVSPRHGFPSACLSTDAHRVMPPIVAMPTVCPRLLETNRRSFSRHPRFTLPRPCAPPAYYSQHRGRFHFSLFAAPSGFHPHLTSALRTLLPPLRCCSCKMSRSTVHATRAVPWQ
jgi:hypothetical protein